MRSDLPGATNREPYLATSETRCQHRNLQLVPDEMSVAKAVGVVRRSWSHRMTMSARDLPIA